MSLVLVLRTSTTSTVLLGRRAGIIARLRIASRLLITAAWLLFWSALLELRLTTRSLMLLELWPVLGPVSPRSLFLGCCSNCGCRTGLLMILKLRPALSTVVVECLRLPMIVLVSVEPHRAFSGSCLRMSAVVARVEVAIGARSFHVVHLHRSLAHVPLAHRIALFRTRIVADSVTSTVERNAPLVHDRVTFNHSAVDVNIADMHIVHTHHCRVVFGNHARASVHPQSPRPCNRIHS